MYALNLAVAHYVCNTLLVALETLPQVIQDFEKQYIHVVLLASYNVIKKLFQQSYNFILDG